MASSNVETVRAAHQAFNRRDFDAVLSTFADDAVYQDRARGVTFEGRQGVREFLQGWAGAFSNASVTEPQYLDAGNTVVAEFTGRGRHDGPLGPFPATGNQLNLPFCEIVRFDAAGRIRGVTLYYDQATMLAQLGLAQSAGTMGV